MQTPLPFRHCPTGSHDRGSLAHDHGPRCHYTNGVFNPRSPHVHRPNLDLPAHSHGPDPPAHDRGYDPSGHNGLSHSLAASCFPWNVWTPLPPLPWSIEIIRKVPTYYPQHVQLVAKSLLWKILFLIFFSINAFLNESDIQCARVLLEVGSFKFLDIQ
jgi:hypothetical protein